MLYILYGTVADIGNISRKYFEQRDFVWIQKDTYVIESSDMMIGRDKRLVTAEEIERCQYSYNVLNRKVGFNESDIVDAVFGKQKRLLTVSTDDIEIVKNLKRAFGDYVVLIYAYIDEDTIRSALVSSYPEMSESELDIRLALGRSIKQTYLNNAELFDETVIFGGEFGNDELFKQFDRIITRYDRIEKQLNNNKYVELPYAGKRDYAFISYAHENMLRVYPVMQMLQINKCRIWYDDGIRGGENWRKTVRTKIKHSKLVLLFSSAASYASAYVMFEYTEAQAFKIPTLVIHLDDNGFPKGYEGLQYLDLNVDNFNRKLLDGIAKIAGSTFTVKPKKPV